MENEFVFKSSSIYYDKEKADVKNNTVREIDLDDDRFTQLIAWSEIGWNDGDIKIKIIDAFLPGRGEFFIRDIRDISIWDGLMIITWNPKKGRGA